LFFTLQTTSAQTVYPDYTDGVIYLKLKDTCKLELAPYAYTHPGFNLLCTGYGINVPGITKPFPDTSISKALSKIYQIHFTDTARIDSLIAKLSRFGEVEYAEMHPISISSFTPNDIESSQWYLSKINAQGAWDLTQGSANVVIAIVDNAVRITHTDLVSNLWVNPGEIPGNLLDDDLNGYTDDVNGYDVADRDPNPNPPASTINSSPFVHGTHCAGIASAKTNNGIGMASVGFNCRIMAVKCTPNTAKGDVLSNSYDGVYYTIRAKANIISMSFGGKGYSATGQSIMNTANSLGITLIAAAGNNNTDTLFYPAAFNNVIGVGASNESDQKSSFSNYGSYIDLVAPGNNIYSTLAGSDAAYGKLNGTSMATPIVAGVAALVKSANPSFSPAQIEAALKKGCVKIDNLNPSFAGKLGAGRINAFFAVNPGAINITETKEYSISIYPNPFNSSLKIELYSGNPNTMHLDLFNLLGEKVFSFQPVSSSFTFETNLLPSGIYTLQINTPEGRISKKVVKN